jgi:hypothetical protein
MGPEDTPSRPELEAEAGKETGGQYNDGDGICKDISIGVHDTHIQEHELTAPALGG